LRSQKTAPDYQAIANAMRDPAITAVKVKARCKKIRNLSIVAKPGSCFSPNLQKEQAQGRVLNNEVSDDEEIYPRFRQAAKKEEDPESQEMVLYGKREDAIMID
jgi:hypothetical protein